MYTSFYGLSKKPFAPKTDPDFLWIGDRQGDIVSSLIKIIEENSGMLLLSGEAGVGKTALVSILAGRCVKDSLVAMIAEPYGDLLDFYSAIGGGFGLADRFHSKVQFLLQFSQFLHSSYDMRKRVLLIVDDCHALSREMLEELRLLSSIEQEGGGLINILFVGQPAFKDLLAQAKNDGVQKMLALQMELRPFSEEETEAYIVHRFMVAGRKEKPLTGRAVKLIHEHTQGNPRTINLLSDRILAMAAEAGLQAVNHSFVNQCLHDEGFSFEEAEPQENLEEKRAEQLARSKEVKEGRATTSEPVDETLPSWPTKRRWWLKYVVGFMVIALVGGYCWVKRDEVEFPYFSVLQEVLEKPKPEEGQKNSLHKATAPRLTVFNSKEKSMDVRRETTLKKAILKQAYSSSSSEERLPEGQDGGQTLTDQTGMGSIARPLTEALPAHGARRLVLPLQSGQDPLSEAARNRLVDFLTELDEYPRARLQLICYIASEDESPENLRASKERAKSLLRQIAGMGVDPGRVGIKDSEGKKILPLGDGEEENVEGDRVEILVVEEGAVE